MSGRRRNNLSEFMKMRQENIFFKNMNMSNDNSIEDKSYPKSSYNVKKSRNFDMNSQTKPKIKLAGENYRSMVGGPRKNTVEEEKQFGNSISPIMKTDKIKVLDEMRSNVKTEEFCNPFRGEKNQFKGLREQPSYYNNGIENTGKYKVVYPVEGKKYSIKKPSHWPEIHKYNKMGRKISYLRSEQARRAIGAKQNQIPMEISDVVAEKVNITNGMTLLELAETQRKMKGKVVDWEQKQLAIAVNALLQLVGKIKSLSKYDPISGDIMVDKDGGRLDFYFDLSEKPKDNLIGSEVWMDFKRNNKRFFAQINLFEKLLKNNVGYKDSDKSMEQIAEYWSYYRIADEIERYVSYVGVSIELGWKTTLVKILNDIKCFRINSLKKLKKTITKGGVFYMGDDFVESLGDERQGYLLSHYRKLNENNKKII